MGIFPMGKYPYVQTSVGFFPMCTSPLRRSPVTKQSDAETEATALKMEMVTVLASVKENEVKVKELSDKKARAKRTAEEKLHEIFAVLSKDLSDEVYKRMRHEILNTVAIALQ